MKEFLGFFLILLGGSCAVIFGGALIGSFFAALLGDTAGVVMGIATGGVFFVGSVYLAVKWTTEWAQ